jgi:hypothetical protein
VRAIACSWRTAPSCVLNVSPGGALIGSTEQLSKRALAGKGGRGDEYRLGDSLDAPEIVMIATGSEDATVKVWDAVDQRCIRTRELQERVADELQTSCRRVAETRERRERDERETRENARVEELPRPALSATPPHHFPR